MKRPQPWLMFTTDPGDGGGSTPTDPPAGDAAKTFTQDEVNALVGNARTEERRKVASKFADYDDLKAKAEAGKTLEGRLASLEAENASIKSEALRSRIQAKHGISDEDAALFLTGADEEALTAQAARLAEREADRKKQGNVAPSEGDNPNPGGGDSETREFVRGLFARAD